MTRSSLTHHAKVPFRQVRIPIWHLSSNMLLHSILPRLFEDDTHTPETHQPIPKILLIHLFATNRIMSTINTTTQGMTGRQPNVPSLLDPGRIQGRLSLRSHGGLESGIVKLGKPCRKTEHKATIRVTIEYAAQ